jgi:transposase InsO family protein
MEAEEQIIRQRKRYSAEFKARMAFEAHNGEKTLNELASEYGVHLTYIARWKKHLESEGPRLFAARLGKQEQASGFIYVVAVLDWFSRYVVSWAVSLTLEVGFCVEALERVLEGAQPEIFNSDQDTQFTSPDRTGCVCEEARLPLGDRSTDGAGHLPPALSCGTPAQPFQRSHPGGV